MINLRDPKSRNTSVKDNSKHKKLECTRPCLKLAEAKSKDSPDAITYLPFYGGAKGQMLQLFQAPDGTLNTQILKKKPSESPPVAQESQFNSIKAIHQTALNIIRLQEAAKINGELNDEEREQYNANMKQLNLSTKKLAAFQQEQADFADKESNIEDLSRSNLKSWFERKKEKLFFKQSEEQKEEQKEEEKEEQKEEEENVGEESENEEGGDGVAINLPPEDASVAEAKPVGIAIAGVGGVASSKPIATAVVGPMGLAIARPVATAIAGVSPEEALIPISADGYLKIPSKKKDKKPIKEENKPESSQGNKEKEKGKESGKEMGRTMAEYLSSLSLFD